MSLYTTPRAPTTRPGEKRLIAASARSVPLALSVSSRRPIAWLPALGVFAAFLINGDSMNTLDGSIEHSDSVNGGPALASQALAIRSSYPLGRHAVRISAWFGAGKPHPGTSEVPARECKRDNQRQAYRRVISDGGGFEPTMMGWGTWPFILALLVAIALGATDVALTLEVTYGPHVLLAAVGSLLAALGGAVVAVMLTRS